MTVNYIVKIIYYLGYIIIATINAAPFPTLSNGFTQCKISDPNFDECVRDGIQKALPYLAKGIPSLNIIKIDPLRLITLSIDHSLEGEIVNMELRFKDLDIYNIKYAQIIKAHYDPINYTMDTEINFPKSIIMKGNYELYGNALFIPLVGKGKCEINLDLSKSTGFYQMQPVEKQGNVYLEIVKLKWEFIATKMSVHFDNLFNEKYILGSGINLFLNENWESVLVELHPSLEDVFAQVHLEIIQQFLSRIPLNKIFVD